MTERTPTRATTAAALGAGRGWADDRPLVWRAGRDETAHGHRMARGITRTLCGELIVEHRAAWPPKRRCPECRAAAEAPVS